MRFARIGDRGSEVPVVAGPDGIWRDLRDATPDITGSFLAEKASGLDLNRLPVWNENVGRFGPPLVSVGKVVCVGINYRDHAAETGSDIPLEPVLFMKGADTIVGPDDGVLIPRGSTKTDWEVELAVVIGRTARYVDSVHDGLNFVAGYAISNDVSEREFQLERSGQWDKGKNCETFNPLGPWIATPDEVPDPQALGLRLWVNGKLRQDGNTKEMAYGVAHLVWYVSQFMVLHPGDVINTGTPAGVALGRPDQPYLRSGDVIEVEVDGLGRQHQWVGQA